MVNSATEKKEKKLLFYSDLFNDKRLKAEDFIDNRQKKIKLKGLSINKPSMPLEKISLSKEEIHFKLAEISNESNSKVEALQHKLTEVLNESNSKVEALQHKLTEVLNESNSKVEALQHKLTEVLNESNSKVEELQQKYQINIESIIFSEKCKESSVVRDLKKEMAKNIEINLKMMPTARNNFIEDNCRKTKKYPISAIENSQFPLKLPKPLAKGEQRSKDHPEYYERWADRENKDETPFEFLERVWGSYIRAGLLYQTDLRGTRTKKREAKLALDRTLFEVLSVECVKHGKHLAEFIQTKSDEVDNRFKQIVSTSDEILKNRRKLKLYSFAAYKDNS